MLGLVKEKKLDYQQQAFIKLRDNRAFFFYEKVPLSMYNTAYE